MPTYREPLKYCDTFQRAQAMSTTPGVMGWTIKDTSSAGTPTYLCIDGGGVKLTLASTSEEEIVTLYHNDVETINIAEIQQVEMLVKVAGIDSVTTLVMGVATDQNDTEDSVTNFAWFRMQGSASTTALVAETDDGTNDKDDIATGATLSSTVKSLKIDFSNGLSDVRFYVDNDRVAASTTFDMSNSTADVQPFIQLHKASGTGVPAVTIVKYEILYSKVYA